MGFSARKKFGPLNVSWSPKKGWNVSAGAGGLRVGANRKGSYVSANKSLWGIRYSKRVSLGRLQPHEQPTPGLGIATIVGSIIAGLILMSAGAPGAAILFVVCAPCLVVFVAWIGAAIRHGRAQTPQPLPPPDKNDPHYYRSPGPFDDYVGKPKETPHGTQDNTTQPLPPVDRTSPDYYWSPGLLDDYRDKSHD